MKSPRLLTLEEIERLVDVLDIDKDSLSNRESRRLAYTARAALKVVGWVKAYEKARSNGENQAVTEVCLYLSLLPFRESEKGGAND
jgi:hypothetical protein